MTNNNELKQIVQRDSDLREAIRFHGHMCPGLAIGYRAAKMALERLGVKRAEDEELVAIVENDSCSVDAVQRLTGCTFGKGNFIFYDYGKQVFTFAIRPSGRAVRVALKPDHPKGGELVNQNRETRTAYILTASAKDLFDMEDMTIVLPQSARIHDTVICEFCGEGVMATRTVSQHGRTSCIPCCQEQSQ